MAVGALLALIHAVWSLAVALIPGPLYSFISWVFTLHHLDLTFNILAFNLVNAIILVVLTFVIGYIIGWLFAAIYVCCGKSKASGCSCQK